MDYIPQKIHVSPLLTLLSTHSGTGVKMALQYKFNHLWFSCFSAVFFLNKKICIRNMPSEPDYSCRRKRVAVCVCVCVVSCCHIIHCLTINKQKQHKHTHTHQVGKIMSHNCVVGYRFSLVSPSQNVGSLEPFEHPWLSLPSAFEQRMAPGRHSSTSSNWSWLWFRSAPFLVFL